VHSNYGISAFWLNPAESAVRIAKIREIYAAVSPFMEGYYANLNEEGNNTTQRNYGIDYDRLTRIKAEYDPGNLFRLNANIKPAT
jgi:hypothetical protein